MKKGKVMRKNRLICLSAILISIVYASIFGGSLSYALVYMSIIIPLTSLVYMFYVYRRFKLYQTYHSHRMVKGEDVPYTYTLANEDILFYKDLGIFFLNDYANIEVADFTPEVSLLPGEEHKKKARLRCRYRGEYQVGIDYILIKDLLGLAQIKAGKPYQINATVYPRIFHLKRMDALKFEDDSKVASTHYGVKKEVLEGDYRSYLVGDHLRQINWRLSAKQQELFVREYIDRPREHIRLILDLHSIPSEQDAIIVEDRIIEVALAIVQFYVNANIAVEVQFFLGQMYRYPIRSTEDFQQLYERLALIKFNEKKALYEVLPFLYENAYLHGHTATRGNIIIAAQMNQFMAAAIASFEYHASSSDSQTYFLYIGESTQQSLQEMQGKLGKAKLLSIPLEGDIEHYLAK